MVNFFTFSFVTGLLTVAAADIIQPASTLSGTIAPMLEPLQSAAGLSFDKLSASPAFDKKGSLDLPTPVLSQTLPDRTRKVPERITQHISRRSLFKQTKVHAYLLEALNAILPHARTIQRLCVHAEEHFDDKLSWELVTELRAILEALNTLLLKVKVVERLQVQVASRVPRPPLYTTSVRLSSKSCARLENVASQLVGCASSTKLYARFAKIRWYKSLAAFRAL
ncbi:hypothetical protein H4Q26_006024 [Puccinia striiformis f. sp. tritici PST-130]|nr:hypothetical protein H4Q26_006024 [Puccinia striiformis f. sp. tritici PST-130]